MYPRRPDQDPQNSQNPGTPDPEGPDSSLSPDESEQPVSPEEPEQSLNSEGPESSLSPDESEQPANSEGPESSLSPEGPDSPLSPEEPEQSLNSEGPDSSLSPEESEQSANSEGPDSSLSPEESEQSANSEGPDSPLSPEEPEQSANSEGPDSPLSPQGPGQPRGPQGSWQPRSPQGPGQPRGPQGSWSPPRGPRGPGFAPQRPTGQVQPRGPRAPQGPWSPPRGPSGPGRFVPQRPNGPGGPSRFPGGPNRPPNGPGREIPRRDFHAPTINGPGARSAYSVPNRPETRDDLWRLFIAADLSTDAKSVLTGTAWKIPEHLRPSVRWSRADMMHLTLRFLGDTPEDKLEDIKECMTDAAKRSGKFTLRLDDTGAFPDLRQPKVLWVGIKGEVDRLQMLHARLEGSLTRIGLKSEDRHYNPHLTVGRLQREVPAYAAGQLGQAFAHIRLPEPRPEILVDSLVLYRSRLMLDGPSYEELARAPLG